MVSVARGDSLAYDSFYRYIYEENGKYWLIKNGERFIDCKTLPEALFERDRFENVGWDWDKYVQLPHTMNGYIHIDLPPFEHKPSYIAHEKECWLVRGHGRRQKYYGTYYTREEAEKVARIYRANIQHKNEGFRVLRKINGKQRYYGRYPTRELAEERVKELMESDWSE